MGSVALDFSQMKPIPSQGSGVTLDFSKAQPINTPPPPPAAPPTLDSRIAEFSRTRSPSEMGSTLPGVLGKIDNQLESTVQNVGRRALGGIAGLAAHPLNAIGSMLQTGRELATTPMLPSLAVDPNKTLLGNTPDGPIHSQVSQFHDAYAKNPRQALEGLTGDMLGMYLTGKLVDASGRSLISQLPSKGRAGASFQALNQNLADQPVPLKAALEPLQRAAEVGVRGSTLPKSVSDLLTRSQSPIEMTFPEARDYQASLSDLSTSDKLAMNGRMRGAVAQLNKHLYSDIYDAADTQGRGPQYAQAMKEYRQAAQLGNALKTTGKVVVGAAGAGGAYHYLRDVLGSGK